MAPRRPPQPLAGDRRYNTDFVQRFTQREEERRVAKRPKALTAGQHAALREQLKNFQFLKPDYADNTKISIAGILRKWKSYCKDAERWGSWQNVIRNADRTEAMDFLEYLCQSYRIKSWGTSWEYFRQYKQLYASVSSRYMDRNDSREVQKVSVGIGPLPPVLPATINDAITFTKELGFGYLWVDYIYIDQEDPAEKAE
ncbi:hypothetical protein L209DRAFT_779004 [Thermothelomyces heterothallicus CBS 203.75]